MKLMEIRILIVDDNAVFREGLRNILEDHVGWQVCGEAENGMEAVKKNRLLVPQVIVMDLSMPYMTGIEAAHEIFKEFPRVPILLLTLYLTPQLAEKVRDSGIRAILSKIEMRGLVGEIEAIVRNEDATHSQSRDKEYWF